MTRTLKRFQREVVETGAAVLDGTLGMIAQAPSRRRLIALERGTVLIEAPTGSGKTLMMGRLLERVGATRDVVWFWFTPFSGLVNQTIETLRTDCTSLRLRDPRVDRGLESTQPCDVLIATWGSVASQSADSRRMRRDDEVPSIDALIEALRAQGTFIGAVIDEAHHSFKTAPEALRFYLETLRPDVTVLATATPRDRDVDTFRRRAGIPAEGISRLSVSRSDVVAARLNKRGIKAVSFRPYRQDERYMDCGEVALRAAWGRHCRIKQALAENGINLTPLMLVQVGDGQAAPNEARQLLIACGVPETAIAVHTASEPDPALHTLAYEEAKEVLIFKMAVATGFDAPRAFTLASLRRSSGVEFGLQIIGRIMRVHARLQPRDDLPAELEHGYVFLANADDQAGLAAAADEISTVMSEIRTVTDTVSLISVANGGVTAVRTRMGMLDALIEPETPPAMDMEIFYRREEPPSIRAQALLNESWFRHEVVCPQGHSQSARTRPAAGHRYPLRSDIDFPRQFRTERLPDDHSGLIAGIARNVDFNDSVMAVYSRAVGRVVVNEEEIFTHARSLPTHESHPLSERLIYEAAQRTLSFNDSLHPRQLRLALLGALRQAAAARGWPTGDENALRRGLERILAAYPRLVADACRQCLSHHVHLDQSSELPVELVSGDPLPPSRHSIYGVLPTLMNSWEVDFARLLDEDETDTIRWWHRNLPHKPWSVAVVRPSGERYFPDFVVGVEGRRTPDGVALVETKRDVYCDDSVDKARCEHGVYRSVLMVHRLSDRQWVTVRHLPEVGRNELGRQFRVPMLVEA